MNATLIGLAGYSRVGKDTIAQYLWDHHKLFPIAFAQPLYEMLATSGIDPTYLVDARKDTVIPELGKTGRELVQTLGDWYRANLGEMALINVVNDVWTDYSRRGESMVVKDVRTADEVNFVRAIGGRVWWVSRPNSKRVNAHHTESFDELFAAHHKPTDIVIQNHGSIHYLQSQVENALVNSQRHI